MSNASNSNMNVNVNVNREQQMNTTSRDALLHPDPTIIHQIVEGEFDVFPTSMRNHIDRMVVITFIERVLNVCYKNFTDRPTITQATEVHVWEAEGFENCVPGCYKYIELFIQTHILRELYHGRDNPPSFIVFNSETNSEISTHSSLKEAVIALLLMDTLTSIKHVLFNTFRSSRDSFSKESITQL
jgi:hypothetical protein